MSGFTSAPPPRWVGVVGQRRGLAGTKPATHLLVHGTRLAIRHLFPRVRDQLPLFERGPQGQVLDLCHQPTVYGVPL